MTAPIISLDVEHFLSFMFGKDGTHGLADSDEEVWVKYVTKLASHLRKYVERNVVTSAFHWGRIEIALTKVENASNNPRLREPELVAALVQLSLLLIGNMPNHWAKKRVGHSNHFLLNEYRTHHYSQDWQQKAALIRDTVGQRTDQFSWARRNAMWKRYIEARGRGDFRGFCDWFEESYPDTYTELFLA